MCSHSLLVCKKAHQTFAALFCEVGLIFTTDRDDLSKGREVSMSKDGVCCSDKMCFGNVLIEATLLIMQGLRHRSVHANGSCRSLYDDKGCRRGHLLECLQQKSEL